MEYTSTSYVGVALTSYQSISSACEQQDLLLEATTEVSKSLKHEQLVFFLPDLLQLTAETITKAKKN